MPLCSCLQQALKAPRFFFKTLVEYVVLEMLSNTFTDRPNMRLEWQTPNAPPVCDFSVSSTNTCSGDIQFFDQSTNSPTTWSWDFGDGGTSTLENPTHTYLANGTYTVSLTTTNAFGSDSETKANYIIVNVSGATPIAATCIS